MSPIGISIAKAIYIVRDLYRLPGLARTALRRNFHIRLTLGSVCAFIQNRVTFPLSRSAVKGTYASELATSSKTIQKQFVIALVLSRWIGVNRRCIYAGIALPK